MKCRLKWIYKIKIELFWHSADKIQRRIVCRQPSSFLSIFLWNLTLNLKLFSWLPGMFLTYFSIFFTIPFHYSFNNWKQLGIFDKWNKNGVNIHSVSTHLHKILIICGVHIFLAIFLLLNLQLQINWQEKQKNM